MSFFRAPIWDLAHRGVVLGCVGLSAYGMIAAYSVHQDTLRRGRELIEQREAEAAVVQTQNSIEEKNEVALAEAAQSALRGFQPKSS
ncbi:hypothetical protein JAAARDRAFT_36570 [Jaapia argillacea MUCL 33604]|uniref:Uncharacterized protein n=1 Tax=Jaapia argillacea MUCL 33604 TaxID=933084 RepID=A0A067Q1D2_9AGAM|nr:hypothetical protein JAAARDRAFT_36570 [Jaapia argillacea MUCL 33604]